MMAKSLLSALRRWWPVLGVFFLGVILGILVATSAHVQKGPQSLVVPYVEAIPSSLETGLVALINGRRRDLGLRNLHSTYPLSMIARYQASDLGPIDTCSHDGQAGSASIGIDPTKRYRTVNYPGTWRGEVVGCRFATPEAVVTGWWDSPHHRAILTLPEINEIGCGAWVGHGEMMFAVCELGQLR